MSKYVNVGGVLIGNSNPISIQSMINVPLLNTKEAIAQINELEMAGCEIVRAAVNDEKNANALKEVLANINLPFVADIHFDYRLAIKAIEAGVHKLRINPGNIGGKDKLRVVCDYLKEYKIPVRIGINAGSLEKDLLLKYGHPTPEALVESAKRSIDYFNEFGYDDIVVSIKSSDVVSTYQANILFAKLYDYPIHLGITESGSEMTGVVRSSVGIGAMLLGGVGDTLRVSLTGEPVQEIYAAKEILSACNLRSEGVRVISCPTCGRTRTDIVPIIREVKEKTKDIKVPINIAIMGCVVNGPGEAKEADLGIACGVDSAVLFVGGERIKKINAVEMVDVLVEEIKSIEKKKVEV